MSISYFRKHLQAHEHIQQMIQSCAWVKLLRLTSALLMIWVPLFFYPLLMKYVPELAPWVVAVVTGAGVVWLLRIITTWKFSAWVITEKRLIDFDQKGFWQKHVSDVKFSAIGDVSVSQKGLWANIWRYGTVKVKVRGEQSYLEMDGVVRPHELHKKLRALSGRFSKGGEPALDAVRTHLRTLQKELGKEDFFRVLQEFSKDVGSENRKGDIRPRS